MRHFLEIDSVYLEIDTKVILSNIYLKCETGMITGLLGKNGTGKSCLMKIIFGILDCESSVRLDNRNFKHIFKHHNLVSYLPQHNFLPNKLSINEVFYSFQIDYTCFENFFPEFKNKHKFKLYNLSGGEKRLIEIYTILFSDTKFSLLDEPFTHLTPLQIGRIKQLIFERKTLKGILISDHLYNHIIDISDSLYFLKTGKTTLVNSIDYLDSMGYIRLH